MAKQLYESEPVFRATVDECSDLLAPFMGRDLRSLLYPENADTEEAKSSLNQTIYTQPALFVVEYALAQVWKLWGIEPEAMLGNSIGEYVAACLAGVFSLEEALRVVSARGALIQSLEPGAMLAVPFGEEQARSLIGPELSLAVVSGPSSCVYSGSRERIHQFKDQLAARGLNTVLLATSHAFHSHMMERALPTFQEIISKVRLQRPRIPFISNVTGTWITGEDATDPAYWVKHLRQTVRLGDGMDELLRTPNPILLEVGPGRTLGSLIQQCGRSSQISVLSSVRHHRQQASDEKFILETLARLWSEGAKVDWEGFHRDERRYRVPLPTYPFERESYWIEPAKRSGSRNETELSEKSTPLQTIPAREGDGFVFGDYGSLESERRAKLQKGKCKDAQDSSGSNSELKGHSRPPLSTPFSAPSNNTEKAVCRIWETLLGIRGIGIHDDLFDLGGQSLTAIQLISHLRSAFAVDVPVNAVFEAPTVASISKLIEQLTAATKPSAPVSIARIPRAASRLKAPLKTSKEKTGILS
jgi:acyl transferase domain-containing protein/acyl carrier protein